MNVQLARRRRLRRESTDAEAILWAQLRAHRFAGFKFRRQHPCGAFILDFYCPGQRLAIELDGGQHFVAESQAFDARRTHYLAEQGIAVMRFASDAVFRELDAVLFAIAAAVGIEVGPSPYPP